MTTADRPLALVTGGSLGLGLALTTGLLDAGWEVLIDGRDVATLSAAAEALGRDGLTAIAGDVGSPQHRQALVAAIDQKGRLDLLVNNASVLGPSPQPPLHSYPLDVLRKVYEVNVVAPLALIQEFLPFLRRSHGVVVNLTSDAAVEGYEGWGGYGSSKAALEQISRVLAAEESEVSVYWVDPGDMNTRMQQEAFPGEDVSDRPPPAASVPGLLRLLAERPPSGRYQARQLA